MSNPPTPRTDEDARLCKVTSESFGKMVGADFARNLEIENQKLREMLAIVHAGVSLYADDGELQDCRELPFIDFKRDHPNTIESSLNQRRVKKLEAEKLKPQRKTIPRRPWVFSSQYGMRFILSQDNEIIIGNATCTSIGDDACKLICDSVNRNSKQTCEHCGGCCVLEIRVQADQKITAPCVCVSQISSFAKLCFFAGYNRSSEDSAQEDCS